MKRNTFMCLTATEKQILQLSHERLRTSGKRFSEMPKPSKAVCDAIAVFFGTPIINKVRQQSSELSPIVEQSGHSLLEALEDLSSIELSRDHDENRQDESIMVLSEPDENEELEDVNRAFIESSISEAEEVGGLAQH